MFRFYKRTFNTTDLSTKHIKTEKKFQLFSNCEGYIHPKQIVSKINHVKRLVDQAKKDWMEEQQVAEQKETSPLNSRATSSDRQTRADHFFSKPDAVAHQQDEKVVIKDESSDPEVQSNKKSNFE